MLSAALLSDDECRLRWRLSSCSASSSRAWIQARKASSVRPRSQFSRSVSVSLICWLTSRSWRASAAISCADGEDAVPKEKDAVGEEKTEREGDWVVGEEDGGEAEAEDEVFMERRRRSWSCWVWRRR